MKKLSILLCTLLLTACAGMPIIFGEKVSQLQPGMSKEQVFESIGRPDGFEPTTNGTVVKYTHKLISGWAHQYTDYYLTFDKNNKLVSVKNSNVIDKSAQVQNSLNNLNNNLLMQQQLRNQQNQQLINNLNQNKVQKVIICKQGDLMCY